MKVPIHVSLDYGLIKEIDKETKNRSRFIARAVRSRLDGDSSTSMDERTTRQLMAALSSRPDCDDTLSKLLVLMLTSKESL